MIRLFSAVAGLLGAFVIVWMALSFVGKDVVALTVTIVIGIAYLVGCIEQFQFRLATRSLAKALDEVSGRVNNLEYWLSRLHPSLQGAVHARIEGERVGLPTPMLTPYLVGLLVMLGLIGTFVGMIVTLQGAVVALEGSTELQAVRAGLTAPIGGLGLAFGTSVAGVAASAMLGLISVLSRRERMVEAMRLDGHVKAAFRDFSLVHHRKETFKALQYQSDALPKVVEKLVSMTEQLERMGVAIDRSLTEKQDQFHHNVTDTYQKLADSVDASLKETLLESSRAVGEVIQPMVHTAMESIHKESQRAYQTMTELAQQHLDQFTEGLSKTTQEVTQAWQQGLLSHQAMSEQMVERLQTSGDELMAARMASEQRWIEGQQERIETLAQGLAAELSSLREQEAVRGAAAVERLSQLEAKVSEHLSELGHSLEGPMSRLIEMAAETPKAAAQVMERLRSEMSTISERDNGLLAERNELMEGLRQLLASLEQSSKKQHESIESFAGSASEVLVDASRQFAEHVESEMAKTKDIADQVSVGAIEMSTLGETFGVAVEQFSQSNQALIESLDRIESSLESSGARSDEQLAYYVNQAREIIDHSMMSQKTVLEELRQMSQVSTHEQEVEVCE